MLYTNCLHHRFVGWLKYFVKSRVHPHANLVNGYGRVTILRGLPVSVREEVMRVWKRLEKKHKRKQKSQGRQYLEHADKRGQAKAGSKGSSVVKVSHNWRNKPKQLEAGGELALVKGYIVERPPWKGAKFSNCRVVTLNAGVRRAGMKWSAGSHGVTNDSSGKKVICKVNKFLDINRKDGRDSEGILSVIVECTPILSTKLGVFTFNPNDLGPERIVAFSKILNLVAVVPEYNNNPNLRCAVIAN
jgi:hypothetical protein